MPTLLLLRHGRTSANASGVLAGRTKGVRLDPRGQAQAREAAARLVELPVARIVSSPLVRCRETAQPLARDRDQPVLTDSALTECDYGQWQGQALAELAKHELWPRIQQHPSAVTFPGGESMAAMSARATQAVRRHDALVAEAAGEQAVWVAISHGDVIKAILADALGLHLDNFQRIAVDPASISIVNYGTGRATVLAMNTHAGSLAWLAQREPAKGGTTHETVGGGAGPGHP